MYHGYRCCSSLVDRFSRWPEAIPLKDVTSDTVATTFYAHWVARFGAPQVITTDRGAQFEAALFRALTNLLGCKRIRTTAYHPASNGLVERWHRALKTAIMCHETSTWVDALPTVLFGPRTCSKEDIKSSTAELLYGTTLRIPEEFFDEEDPLEVPQIFIEKHRQYMRKLKPRLTAHHIKYVPFAYKDLYTCTHVFVREAAVRRPLKAPPNQREYSRRQRIRRGSKFFIRVDIWAALSDPPRIRVFYTSRTYGRLI